MKLDKELVGASSAIIVLSILFKGDSYGYAIIQRVRELSSGEIEWTDGMLYPVLHWLRKRGQIESRWVASKTGRKRCYYSLRAKGRKTLRDQKQQWELVSSTLDRLWQTPTLDASSLKARDSLPGIGAKKDNH
jgi:PadR family transcriptional regulator, regulatory protein PadR